jgi:phosphatidylinositol alpha-1,6-mannosyltransferase
MSGRIAMLALVTDAFGGRGGIAEYNRNLLTALAESGLLERVVVLPRHGGGGAVPPGGVLEQQPPRAGRAAYALAALRTAWQRPFDIVFCGHLYMAPLARLIARLKRAKLVVQMHGIEAWRTPGALQRRALEAADLVLCVSRRTRAAVLGWAALAGEKVPVLANTVGAAYGPGPPAPEVSARHALEGRKVLLTVSRIGRADRYKGHETVIRALPALRRRHPEVLYLVAGEGDDRPRLEALAAGLGLEDAVRFLGHVPDGDLPDLYRAAHVFVMPSTGEGFGIVFLEAAACGLRVVAGNRDGSVDALGEGALGTLIDPDDGEALVAALLAALDSLPARGAEDPRRAELARAVEARFGRRLFAARARALVERLMAGKESRK